MDQVFTTTTVAMSFLLALGVEMLLLNATLRFMRRAVENSAATAKQRSATRR